MFVRLLPLVAGIVPFVGVTIAYWLGVESGQLPACIPYLDGCTSISATGRNPPGSFVFKAIQLPLATLLVVTWYFAYRWLETEADGKHPRKAVAILVCGLVAALALVVYVTFLGTEGPVYRYMRRFGIYFYFLGTAMAQLLFSLGVLAEAKRHADNRLRRYGRVMLGLVALPFVLGILNLVLKAVLADADQSENRIEWLATLSMQAWLVVLYMLWRHSGFEVRVATRRSDAANEWD